MPRTLYATFLERRVWFVPWMTAARKKLLVMEQSWKKLRRAPALSPCMWKWRG